MRMMTKRFTLGTIAAAATLAAVTACGTGSGEAGGGAAGGEGDGPAVEIVQPADGDTVSLPFTLQVDSSEELGPTSAGLHHVHVYFDGDDSTYEVIEDGNLTERPITAESPAAAGLSPGEHTLNISLRNADHSPAGAEDEITITVEAAG